MLLLVPVSYTHLDVYKRQVPGSSIRIDLTETLTGQVEYESRQLKFSLGKMEREDLWPVFYRTFLKARCV